MQSDLHTKRLWIERCAKRLIKSCKNNSVLIITENKANNFTTLQSKLPQTTFTLLNINEFYSQKTNSVNNSKKHYGMIIVEDILNTYADVYDDLLPIGEFIIIESPPKDTPPVIAHYIDEKTGICIGFNQELHSINEIIQANQARIAVYGIYKNEQKFMKRFLQSVQTADEIVLCDTGSTDQTNEIVANFKETHPEVNLHVYSIYVSPWRFDDARNTALSLVSSDIDLCIALDIDEYLMDDWKTYLIKEWEFGYTRYNYQYKTFWSEGGETQHYYDWIHARSGYLWKLPVHEILEYNDTEKIKWILEFWVYHTPDSRKSRSIYFPLLEQSVKERTDIWGSWSFLAKEYLTLGRYEDALAAIHKALELDSNKPYLYKLEYIVYKEQNKIELALASLHKAISHMSRRREPYFDKAIYLHEINRNIEAYYTIKEAEKITNRIIDYHYNPSAWDDNFEQLKAKVLELARKEGSSL